MTPKTPEATLAALQAALAGMLDPLDIPGEWTPRQRNVYEAERHTLDRRIRSIRTTTPILADVEPRIARDTAYRDALTHVRQTLGDELLALPPRIRTGLDLGRQENLKLSILTVDHGLGVSEGSGWVLETLRVGALMHGAGVSWSGSMSEVEHRLKDLTARRDNAQAELDEALLDDAERARIAAERAARKAAPQRKVRGDGTQFDRWPDGRVVEVSTVDVTS